MNSVAQATLISTSGYVALGARQTIKILTYSQITNPAGQYETNEKSISNGDYSFTAKHDGKYIYCFGNENWGANTKEVSFNVHGIVYVSEHEMPADPLDREGK